MSDSTDILAQIQAELHRIHIQLVRNTDSLEHHIRRTALLEEAYELLLARLLPLEKQAFVWAFLAKAAAVLGSLGGLLLVARELLIRN